MSAQDNNGVEPFNAVSVTVSLVVLNDFQRVAIRFNARLDAINSKEDQIVRLACFFSDQCVYNNVLIIPVS